MLHDDLKLLQNSDLAEANWSKQTITRNILWRYQSKDRKWPWLVGCKRFERCGCCRALATLPVSRNSATKRWLVLLSGTLFLPKSALYCCCVRGTNLVAEYTSTIYYPATPQRYTTLLRIKSFSWIHIGVKRISRDCCLHHLKNMEKNFKT